MTARRWLAVLVLAVATTAGAQDRVCCTSSNGCRLVCDASETTFVGDVSIECMRKALAFFAIESVPFPSRADCSRSLKACEVDDDDIDRWPSDGILQNGSYECLKANLWDRRCEERLTKTRSRWSTRIQNARQEAIRCLTELTK